MENYFDVNLNDVLDLNVQNILTFERYNPVNKTSEVLKITKTGDENYSILKTVGVVDAIAENIEKQIMLFINDLFRKPIYDVKTIE